MKSFTTTFFLTLAFFTLTTPNGYSQNVEIKDSLRAKRIEVAKGIISRSGICTLITLDEKGLPMARAMDPFSPEEDFTVWFGTNPYSRKVKQIINNPIVTLYYLDTDASGYVVIHGTAELVNDASEKETHWKDAWNAFYPNKTEGYLLIKVTPNWMEVLSTTHGITGDPKTWETPTVVFENKH